MYRRGTMRKDAPKVDAVGEIKSDRIDPQTESLENSKKEDVVSEI